MDPLSISLAIAPLLLASAKLTKQINEFVEGYRNATTTLTSICTECKLIHVALCKIQGLVYQSNSILTARLSSEKSLRDTFDSALTGCRMTIAAVDVEIRQLIDSEGFSHSAKAEFGFKRKLRYVWKEDLMQSLLDQTRGQMASIQFLISLLQSETLSEILRLVQTNKEPLRKNFSKARSLRSDQGFEDDLSTFDSDGRSIAHDVAPTYEKQLQRSPAYQKAQTATAQELLAGKLKLSEANFILEEKVDDLELEINLKESLLDDLRGQVAAKDASIDRMVLDLRRNEDESKKMELKKDRLITTLNDEIADLSQQVQQLGLPGLLTLEPLVPDTKSQGVYQPSERPVLGREWTLDSLRTSPYSSSAPNILFHLAANAGDAEAARFIYDTTSVDDMYVDPKTNMNALQIASMHNFFSLVKTLLSLGLTFGHHQALQIAVDNGHDEIVRMLRHSGARLLELPLSAVQNGHEVIVTMLIRDNVDISDPRLLECAVINRHDGIVKALSRKGPPDFLTQESISRSLCHNRTALERAAFNDETGRLTALLKAPLSQPVNIFLSSLYYAICSSHGRCLKILLDYAVNNMDQGSIDICVLFRKALELALCMGNVKMQSVLMENQYDRSVPPSEMQSELALQRSVVSHSGPELRRTGRPWFLTVIVTIEIHVDLAATR